MVASRIEDLQVKEAIDKVAALTPLQFEQFQQELLRLQDDDSDTMTDEWLAKMNARIARLDSGEAKLVSGDEARANLVIRRGPADGCICGYVR